VYEKCIEVVAMTVPVSSMSRNREVFAEVSVLLLEIVAHNLLSVMSAFMPISAKECSIS
jgi:hypothetical protein